MSPAIFLLTGLCFAQEPNREAPTIRTTVPLVVAPTSVTTRDGKIVDGLTENDFILLDNGRPQKIDLDASYSPISLVVAIQSNGIAASALEKIRKIGAMIEPLLAGHRGDAAVLTYDDEVSVAQPFTSDSQALSLAFRRIEPGGGNGRMVDAVDEAVRILATRGTRRRVVLLIGETRDRGSKAKLEDVVTRAQEANVTIYTLTYSAYLTPFSVKAGATTPGGYPVNGAQPMNLLAIFSEIGRLAKENGAEAFSRYTGGLHLSFLRQKALEQAVSRIGEDLHSQYLLSFTPSLAGNDEFHQIEVRVRHHEDVRVRTRPGYWVAP